MSAQPSLRIHVEFGKERLDFEGNPDEVFKAFTDFFNKIYPAFEMARQLMFMPDIGKLAESLTGIVEIGTERPILVSGRELPTDETIVLVLLGSYIGNRLAKLQKSSLTSDELSKAAGKAHKTVMNQLPKLVEGGLVEKVDKEYKISDFGIIRAQSVITNYKSSKTEEKSS